MSYGYHRLGSNVPGKVMPVIGPNTLVAIGDTGTVVTAERGAMEVTLLPQPTEDLRALRTEPVSKEEFEPAPITKSNAKLSGYTGDECHNPNCRSMRVRRNGTCTVCEDCGQTTGCS